MKIIPTSRKIPAPFFDVAAICKRLNSLPPEQAVDETVRMSRDHIVMLLEHPEFLQAHGVVTRLTETNRAGLLDDIAEDRLTDLLGQLDEHERDQVFHQLPHSTRISIRQLLRYPDFTAGAMMTTEFVSVPDTSTVSDVMRHLREVEKDRETIFAIFAQDKNNRLNFVLSLRQLISADPETPIRDLPHKPTPITVSPMASEEDVARLIRLHDLLALGVIDEDGKMLGIVTVDDVIDTMMESATQDMQKFGGSGHLNGPYLNIGFFTSFRKRVGWLAILFFGEMLTASAMQHFEHELEKAVVLAMFIPLIMSSGGNSGSQSTSLIIRSLALNELRLSDWWRVALRELPTGISLGFVLGMIGFSRIMLWQMLGLYDYGPHAILIASTVGAALVGIVTFGTSTGSMLPFILQRLGFDPASASAPFVATLVDVSGLVIYFSVAAAILGGTLL